MIKEKRKKRTCADRGLVGVDDLDIKREHGEIVSGLLVPDLVQDLGDGIELIGQGSEFCGASTQKRGSIEDQRHCPVVVIVSSQERVGLGGGHNGHGCFGCRHYEMCLMEMRSEDEVEGDNCQGKESMDLMTKKKKKCKQPSKKQSLLQVGGKGSGYLPGYNLLAGLWAWRRSLAWSGLLQVLPKGRWPFIDLMSSSN